jgi:4-amino-4-deoxy-L-arabinose transferase-like glycosyltransferase
MELAGDFQMLSLLPITCLAVIVLVLVKRGMSGRAAFLSASIVWGVYLTIVTELLSLFGALTKGWIALAWGGATAVGIAVFLAIGKQGARPSRAPLSRADLALFGGLAFIGLATFVTALAAPPNNWDSMTYHMSRVVHWLQNGSVAHYPTSNLRQLELNPWAEFAIAHLQALSGGDRFANLVQWFSMAGSVIAATLVAGQLGASRRGQTLAAVLAATIPMGILQASSTQNDYVVSFWLICLVWSGMQYMEERRLRWALLAGASLGLALLTKGTAYLYALPFVLWFAWCTKWAPRRAALLVLSVALPVLLLNAGHYGRNWTLFANPLASSTGAYTNEVKTANTVLSNVARNVALHLSTPFKGANRSVEAGVGALHDFLGIDTNDLMAIFPGTTFRLSTLMQHEDFSGNLLHASLASVTLGLLVCRRGYRRLSVRIVPYALAMTAGFLLFCLVLRWQPWGSRLHLPLFVLGAPAIGVVLGRLLPAMPALATASLLLIAALPCALWNTTRPLAPPLGAIVRTVVENSPLPPTILTADRESQYFTSRPDLWRSYVFASRLIKASGATNIGLKFDGDDWEYPLLALIKAEPRDKPRIEHINVDNQSGKISSKDFKPDLLVIIGEGGRPIVTSPGRMPDISTSK